MLLSFLLQLYFYAFDIFRESGIPEEQMHYLAIGLGATELIAVCLCVSEIRTESKEERKEETNKQGGKRAGRGGTRIEERKRGRKEVVRNGDMDGKKTQGRKAVEKEGREKGV